MYEWIKRYQQQQQQPNQTSDKTKNEIKFMIYACKWWCRNQINKLYGKNIEEIILNAE